MVVAPVWDGSSEREVHDWFCERFLLKDENLAL